MSSVIQSYVSSMTSTVAAVCPIKRDHLRNAASQLGGRGVNVHRRSLRAAAFGKGIDRYLKPKNRLYQILLNRRLTLSAVPKEVGDLSGPLCDRRPVAAPRCCADLVVQFVYRGHWHLGSRFGRRIRST